MQDCVGYEGRVGVRRRGRCGRMTHSQVRVGERQGLPERAVVGWPKLFSLSTKPLGFASGELTWGWDCGGRRERGHHV